MWETKKGENEIRKGNPAIIVSIYYLVYNGPRPPIKPDTND